MKELDEFEALGEGAVKTLPGLQRIAAGALFKSFVKVLRALSSRVDAIERDHETGNRGASHGS